MSRDQDAPESAEASPPAPPAADDEEPTRAERNARTRTIRPLIIAVAMLTVLALGLAAMAYLPGRVFHTSPPLRRDAAVYQGLGVWIDVHDDALLDDPQGTVEVAASHEVRTIYLETSNYGRGEDIYRPDAQSAIIEAAHDRGIAVVAWYLPGLDDLQRDLRRSLAAIEFETPSGERFDGFAMDIEATVVRDIGERNQALRKLSGKLRKAVGDYTLGGIIPSPVGLATPFTGFWPNFPYFTVASNYDVMLPMAYSSYRAHGRDETYDYITECFRILREETGDPSIPVHIIGGIAQTYSAKETQGFISAARVHGALGASIYDMATTNAESWPSLEQAPMNPPQWPPLPVLLGSSEAADPQGNIPGGDRTHPKEVFYTTGPVRGAPAISFELLRAPAGEDEHSWKVQLSVNGHRVTDFGPTTGSSPWEGSQRVDVPRRFWNAGGDNVINFIANGNWPDWSTWGVREVEVGG